MSQTERPTTLRGNSSGQRSQSRPPSKRPAGPGPRPARRGFTPSKRSATEGGSIFGGLVASQRVKLGMTQSQLAARMHISRSKVARIEQGQAPDAETQRQLSLALSPERGIGPVSRLAARVAARRRLALPQGSRLLWCGVVVVVVLISMLVVLDGRSSNVGPGPSSLQPTIAASDALGVPGAIHRSRAQANAVAAQIAAKRAAAATAGKAPANEVHRGIPAHPVTEPVSPSSGKGGGGGGSGGSGPDLTDHGVGSHGGNAPQGAAQPSPAARAPAESGGGGSTPAPPPSCVLPGILC